MVDVIGGILMKLPKSFARDVGIPIARKMRMTELKNPRFRFIVLAPAFMQ
jgi:hypothetical protein